MTADKSVPAPDNEMFRPPINRAMRVLDRSFFRKKIPTVAAVIQDPKQISLFKSSLQRDTLHIDRLQAIRSLLDAHGRPTGKKALMLRLSIKKDDVSTWSPKLRELVESSQVHLEPFDVDLDYDYWNYADVMSSILPPELQDDLPQGFSIVGHIAHFNLRDQFLPYKHLIATVLMDKHPNIRTVINKIENVGASNPYRTFNYELLAGEDDMFVEISEENCAFRFDYSKVYWNSRLNTEHARLVETFKPGEAVADVMAGVGPFAVPAGKKGCFVYANDLNPDSYTSLEDAIARNKVLSPLLEYVNDAYLLALGKIGKFVRAYNKDGLDFIQSATEDLFRTEYVVNTTPQLKVSRRPTPGTGQPAPATPKRTYLHQPKTFAHYVLNLPASATTFLSAFVGLHKSRAAFYAANPEVKLPMIHVYCFSTKSEDNVKEGIEICEEISRRLGYEMKPGMAGDDEKEGVVQIFDVRDVAPVKRMFCASFRLPAQVAFAQP